MTHTHRSKFLAALIGAGLLSCAGSAREDNQAPPVAEPRFNVIRPDGASSEPLVVVPRWRQSGEPRVLVPRVRVHGGPDGLFLRSQAGPDRQSGPRLGVNVETSSDGLRVTEVLETSIAASAGVKSGDVLLRVGDEHIDTVGDVRRALAGKKPGGQVKLAVIRAGEGIVELTGTVPEPPADADQADADQARHEGDHTADGSRGGFLGVELKDTEDTAPAPDAAPAQPGAEAGAQPAPQPAPQAGTAGVVIEGVVPDSAAWFAGLEAQDRLISIDGQAVSSRADVVGAVSSKEPGTMVELKYQRGGEERSARVRLGHRPMTGVFGDVPFRGPQGLGGQRLQELLDLHGGQLGPQRLRFDMPDMSDLFDHPDMQLFGNPQPGSVQTLRVEIDGDRMTVERDGQTQHYRRGPGGEWQSDATVSDDGTRA